MDPRFSEIFSSKKICLTLRSVSQNGVTYFANISAKTNLSEKKHFCLSIRGPGGFDS